MTETSAAGSDFIFAGGKAMATADYLSTGFIRRRAGGGIVDLAIEIFHIHARAWAAAHHYERLKRSSEADLAKRGLKRADLSRAAFHTLTGHASAPVHPAADD
jgi:hypothetical protein